MVFKRGTCQEVFSLFFLSHYTSTAFLFHYVVGDKIVLVLVQAKMHPTLPWQKCEQVITGAVLSYYQCHHFSLYLSLVFIPSLALTLNICTNPINMYVPTTCSISLPFMFTNLPPFYTAQVCSYCSFIVFNFEL